MAYTTITQKVLGSDNYAEKKILASDINMIRQAIQTGELDLKPYNIAMEGNEITADAGQNWIRRSGNKFQFYDAGTWKEPATVQTASFTAGEDLAVNDIIYINTTDGKVYKASETNNDWIGVVKTATTTGNSVETYLNGAIVGGFSGLITGEWYGLTTTAGSIIQTNNNIVGIAISTTQIKLIKKENDYIGLLGEIRPVALSLSGALTKSQLQSHGWAICDGTTPTSQGITGATITTTPDLREKFLRHSADETTGGTGGLSEVTLTIDQMPAHSHTFSYNNDNGSNLAGGAYTTGPVYTETTSTVGGSQPHENKPPYYDVCYFIKVK